MEILDTNRKRKDRRSDPALKIHERMKTREVINNFTHPLWSARIQKKHLKKNNFRLNERPKQINPATKVFFGTPSFWIFRPIKKKLKIDRERSKTRFEDVKKTD